MVVGLNTLKNRHRFFIYVETHTKKLNVRVVKGRLVSNSKGYRIYSLVTRRIAESGNAVSIETPSRLFPPTTEELSEQVSGNEGVSNENRHNFATDDVLHDFRDYT